MRPIRAAALGIILAVQSVYAQEAPPPPPQAVPIYITPGQPVTIRGKTVVEEKASGRGIGASASGDAAALKGQNFTPPSATLAPPSANGGAGDIDVSARITGGPLFQWAIGIFGGLVIAAGVLGTLRLGWSAKAMLGCSAFGAMCIARAFWPVFGELLAWGAAAVAIVGAVTEAHGGASATAALVSVFRRNDALRAADPEIKKGMNAAAKFADVPKETPLAEKIRKKVSIT